MRTTDAELAEAVAEQEDQRRHRLTARLRRRHPRRRSVDRRDGLEVKLAAEAFAQMGHV